jgi:hypothetical protein
MDVIIYISQFTIGQVTFVAGTFLGEAIASQRF